MNDSRGALDEIRMKEFYHQRDLDEEMEMKRNLEETRNKAMEVRRSLMETQRHKLEMRSRVESRSEGTESRWSLVEMANTGWYLKTTFPY